jgi:hypothetical protein
MTPCDNRSMGPQVAVSAGASRVRRLGVSLGLVSAMRFPANLTLEPHSHPMATIAVVEQGGFTGS